MTATEMREHILEQVNVALLAIDVDIETGYYQDHVHLRIGSLHYKVSNTAEGLERFKTKVMKCPGFKAPSHRKTTPYKIRRIAPEVFKKRYADDEEVEFYEVP